MRQKLFKNQYLIPFLIILVGLFLRFYNLPNMFYYTMDEEVMNLIQRRIVLLEHFPLIGSVSPLNTYLGPIFYYFGALVLAISNLNPLGQSIFSILLSGVNIFLVYFIGSRFFNRKVGIIAALLFATSFLQTLFDRRYWHLTPGPFLSLIILWSLYNLKLHGISSKIVTPIKWGKRVFSIKYIYLLTYALIFGWNTDYTNLVLFLFVFLSWILFRLPVKRKEVAIALILFVISNAPLVLFDLRHDFLNSKAFVNYFAKHKQLKSSEGTENIHGDRELLGQTRSEQTLLTGLLPFYTLSRLLYVQSDLNVNYQHTYCKNYIFERNNAQGMVLPGIAAVIIISFLVLAFKNRKSKQALAYKLLVSFYLIFQLGVFIYAAVFKGDVFEHYLSSLLPYFFLILGVLLWKIYDSAWRFLAVSIIIIIVSSNIYLILNAHNPFSWKHKLEAANYALQAVSRNDYGLDSIGSCFRYDGNHYPFLYLGKHPDRSYQDPNYSWLYDYTPKDKNPDIVVVVVSKGKYETSAFEETYQKYKQQTTQSKTFGGIEVLIVDNTKGEF